MMTVEQALRISRYLMFFMPLAYLVHTLILTLLIIFLLTSIVAIPLYFLSIFFGSTFASFAAFSVFAFVSVVIVLYGATFYFEVLPKTSVLRDYYDYNLQYNRVLDRRVSIDRLPKFMLTEALILGAIKTGTFYTFRSVPTELLNYDMCLEAVKADGRCLQCLPEEFKTWEVCCIAVEDQGGMIRHVPKDFLNEKMYRKALESNLGSFAFVPDSILTEDFCLSFLKEKPSLIKRIPKALKTKEFYNKAFAINYEVVEHIPKHLVTYKMLYKAVETCDSFKDLLDDEFERGYFNFLLNSNHTPNEDSWIHYKLQIDSVSPETFEKSFFEIHFFRKKDNSNKIVYTCSSCSRNVLNNYIQQGFNVYDMKDQDTIKHCFDCGKKEQDLFSKETSEYA